MRYDFGLIALKVLSDGKWLDVVRPRPKTSLAFDSAGPILHDGDNFGLPRGERMRVRPGEVVIAGGYRDPNRRWLRRGVTWTYTAIDCGVRLTFFALPIESYTYSVFVPADAAKPILRGRSLIAGRSTVRFPVRPYRLQRRAGYASATDPSLNRIRATFTPTRAGPVSITTCKR